MSLGLTGTRRAEATVALAVSLGELVSRSRHIIVGTPSDLSCRWETVGNRPRIVTYSRVAVESALDGRAMDASDVTVRTLGGTVGRIAQIVPGEAFMQRGVRAAFFLHEVRPSLFAVTAMAQGHYPLATDEHGVGRLRASRAHLAALNPECAVMRLDGHTLGEAEGLLAAELRRAH